MAPAFTGSAGAAPGDDAKQRPAQGIRIPVTDAPIMTLDEVRVGMRGYGRSVFAGSAIETFPLVVRSVVSDSSARRGTIWIECTDERMRRSGPVQGMSGSPIYLWDEGEPRIDGEGGRLVGAFAFGYANVNVCLVGVQPIQYMREVGENAVAAEAEDHVASGLARPASPDILARTLTRLTDLAGPGPQRENTALRALARGLDLPVTAPAADSSAVDTAPRPLALPLSVGSIEAARWLAPVLESAGLAVRSGGGWSGAGGLSAGGGGIAGVAPSNVDPGTVVLEPGSVISIPLAWGDLDLNASGTVTEVRPDGTVLAFGHAMDATGDRNLPIATGYTHFVVSRTSISFKQSGSLNLVGALRRDEQAAVAGRPLRTASGPADAAASSEDLAGFDAARVAVRVEMPRQPGRDYRFKVVNDPAMTPGLLAAVVIESLQAVQTLPEENTLRLSGSLGFEGGQTLDLDFDLPGRGLRGVIFGLLPYVAPMMQNPFEPLGLEYADLTVVVDQGIDQLVIESARLDRATARPGESVEVAVRLKPFREPSVVHTLTMPLPADLPAGEYEIEVGDVNSFIGRMTVSRPELDKVENVNELHSLLTALLKADDNTLYTALLRPEPGVALAGQALPALPGSRAAVLGSAANTDVTQYPRFIEARLHLDRPVSGGLAAPLTLVVEPPR